MTNIISGGKELIPPFSRSPIVMKPVSPIEFLDMLREKVANKQLMPTSEGSSLHSKPEYIQGRDLEHFHHKCLFEAYPTYACWDGAYGHASETYVVLPVGDLVILAALKSLNLWVGFPGNGEAWIWPWQNQELCIDRIELANQFNQLG